MFRSGADDPDFGAGNPDRLARVDRKPQGRRVVILRNDSRRYFGRVIAERSQRSSCIGYCLFNNPVIVARPNSRLRSKLDRIDVAQYVGLERFVETVDNVRDIANRRNRRHKQ